MSDAPGTPSLVARSPYELRVALGKDVPDADVRTALSTGDMGFLHSFTTGSTVDGPGVRVVAWTTGCMWRCLYCHNPDTWTLTNGLPVSVARATEQLRKYRHGLRTMGGGFTLSGGEPLMQHRFAVKLLAAAHGLGIHVALDTNGYYGDRLSDAELDLVDLVLLDLKAFDPERHRRLVGFDNAPTLEFARRLSALRKPVWIRYVLVPGFSDDADDTARVAEFAASLGVVQRVDVLPFHKMGEFKWAQLGLGYELSQVEPPTSESVWLTCQAFATRGMKAY